MAIPKELLVLLLGIAILSKVAECASFGSRRGLVETVFDVTRFGARPNTPADSTRGLMMAWRSACQSPGPAKVVIPPGTYTTGETIFQGPCTSPRPITIEIQGTLLSNTDMSLYTRAAWISIEHVDGIVITGGGTLNGQGKSSWQFADKSGSTPPLPSSLVFQTVRSSSIKNLNFVDAKGVHLKITDSSDISVSNVKITAPGDSPNTDGLHISDTINVNVTDSTIGTGDDCISIGDGNSNVYISNINCGPGHGISIGSLGKRLDETDVKGVTVRNCTFRGTTNGARIKTYMGSPSLQVSGVIYEDIILDNVKNPIVIDQHYHSKNRNEPSRVKLVDIHFKNIRGTTTSKIPVALNCSEALPCEGIELVDIDLVPVGSIGPLLPATCQNAKTILNGKNNPPAC
ncbi:polygalacturonase-like [Nicotiana tabacum]|uniref:Polygalacturonase-like n=1 Tax=Nicotiana tabacum TaxID=4097 RepID=A0AC58TI46_TOBAC